jgi:D-alanyl-D-alanine carboxypeptidase
MSSAAVTLVAVGGCSGASAGASTGGITGPSNLAHTLTAIENSPLYQHSDWGISVLDEKSGQVVVGQNDQKMFDPGSTMKIYSISTALRLYGPNYRSGRRCTGREPSPAAR